MDILNTFFAMNLIATAAVLLGFFFLRDSVTQAAKRASARAAGLTLAMPAGLAGAATSMVLLTSVAALFR
jgi:hypothetical protein